MIFEFLDRHLPRPLGPVVCGGLYAAMIVAIWLRWEVPGGVFRYAGF